MGRFIGDGRDEIDRELRHHIDERAEQLVSEGWDPEAAGREAMRLFGDVGRIHTELSDIESRGRAHRSLREVALSIGADGAYALRGMRANPTFTAAVVATLALGVGAAASIFAVADALLFRSLPFPDAERWVRAEQAGLDGGPPRRIAAERLPVWRQGSEELADEWIVHEWAGLSRTDGERSETLDVLAISPGADTLLGIPVRLGRGLRADDALPGAPPTGVLTSRYWDRLGRDPSVIGRTMRLEGTAVLVVGVLGRDTKFPPEGRNIDLWIPLRSDFSYLDRRLGSLGGVWARLAPGVSLASARDRARVLAEALASEHAGSDPWEIELTPVDAGRGEPVDEELATLGATVGVMFLIALLNGVSLLVVRTSGRGRELGVRVALGASRLRLLRQLAVEGVALGMIAGGAAAAMAWWALTGLRRLLPPIVDYIAPHAIQVEARTLVFSFTVATLAGLALGVLPALRAVRRAGPDASSGRRSTGGTRQQRLLRDGLVATQVALSTVLLVAASLLANGFTRLQRVDLGVDVERIAVADLEPSRSRYGTQEERADFAARLEQALERAPEIDRATLSSDARAHRGEPLEAEGRPTPVAQPSRIPWAAVSEDYLETTGARLVEGRFLTVDDSETPNTVVDADLAGFLWAGESPVGHRFRVGEGAWRTVVGVVEELRLLGRDERQGPYQYLVARDPLQSASRLAVSMRSAGPSADELIRVFERTLRQLDGEQSYWYVRTLREHLALDEAEDRFLMTLIWLLAMVAVSLATIGLYGVLSYVVARRTRELGVRLALGAEPLRLRGLVVREGVSTALVGIGGGIVLALQGASWLERHLYDVSPHDPATFGAASLFFLCVAAVAAFVPARRATRIDPVEVLRAE